MTNETHLSVVKPRANNGQKKAKPSLVNTEEMLRRLFSKKPEPLKVDDAEVAQMQKALFSGDLDVMDYVVRDGEGNRLFTFYFRGPGNLKYPIIGLTVENGPIGQNWGQEVQSSPCPKCGTQTKIIVTEREGEEYRGRIMGHKRRSIDREKVVIHCGEVRRLE